MFDANVKLELDDIKNIEAAYRWMNKFIRHGHPDLSGREEFLIGTQKTLQKVNLIESLIHFENNTKKVE